MNIELIEFFKEKGMKRIVEAMRKKYYSYGEIKGTIKLLKPNEQEIEVIKKLGLKCGSNWITIDIKKMLVALGMESSEDLEKLLREELEVDLKTKKEEIELERKEIIRKTTLLLEGVESEKLKEYILKTPSLLNLKEGKELLGILDKLVEGRKDVITLGNLGGRTVYNPHFLDAGTPNYRHLINYLNHYYNEEASNLLEEKALLLKMGIVGDSLSNFIAIYGFKAMTKTNEEYKLVDTDESLNINIGNLYKLQEIEARNKKVLILENPNAFIAIKEEIEGRKLNLSLVCTAGQVNQSGYLFLDKLKKDEIKIYYSGDIDPEGILIGQGLKERYPSVSLIAYSKGILEKYMSRVKLTKERLKKLEKVKIGGEIKLDLLKTLIKESRGAYQEAFYREIVEEVER